MLSTANNDRCIQLTSDTQKKPFFLNKLQKIRLKMIKQC